MDDLEACRRRIDELERELRETRERSAAFTRIAESIDHHVYINEILPGGGRKTLFAGPGRDRLLGGVPADGDWGRAWIEAVHPEDRERYAEHTARYLRGEMSEVRCRIVGLDGVTRWIVGGGMPRREGDRLIVEGIVRDATAEVTAEQRLQEAARTDALTGSSIAGTSPTYSRPSSSARAASGSRPACCCSTSITSRPSTTRTAIRSATRC